MTSLPSQAKAGPPICAICGKTKGDGEHSDDYLKMHVFVPIPAPAALSVEEYAAQFKWAVARFSENVDGAEWVTKTQALEFARHFAVGQPPQDVEALAAKCADLASCCEPPNRRETYIRVWTPKFAELLRPSLPSESPAAPEVPFSLPLQLSNGPSCDIRDSNDELAIRVYWDTRDELDKKRDYIISAVNSHEELKRELEQWTKWGVVEVAVRNPQVADYCNHWEGRAESAEKSASDKEQEIAMLTKDFGELARKAESLLSLNAELRQALKLLLEDASEFHNDDETHTNCGWCNAESVLAKAEKAVRP